MRLKAMTGAMTPPVTKPLSHSSLLELTQRGLAHPQPNRGKGE
jgi:hypothetical protein